MNKIITTTLLSLAITGASFASPITFAFKDPKGGNAIQFHLDSLLEPIAGSADGITGTVTFDPAAPSATSGSIVVAAPSLTVSNSTMRDHLLSAGWIDAAGHPEITFTISSLSAVQTEGNTTKAMASGNFTLKGTTQEIEIPVQINYLPGAFGKRINKPELGRDLLVVLGKFSINRSDFGIRPGQNEDKVAETIEFSIAVVGGAPNA
ncbi:MAG: YceI family protein [Candidatus Synoicihabitans palmerolidicus]|nr:YceI family protein [Candidatus Synoicihabitans palmerolidicus]